MLKIDLVIIGGGPAGMSAAVSAYEAGINDILILERDSTLGGILNQCIHNGFGLHKFNEELTGPEYAYKYEKEIEKNKIKFMTNTMVLDVTKDKTITAINPEKGLFQIQAKTVILSMGCRERSKGALNIPGGRPAGIYSAGAAQKLVNIKGYLPGKEVVILGSGDIGLIMARRMTLEGSKVKAVCEIMSYSGGLARNIEQCLNDFDIPLKLSYTIVKIHGQEILEGVTIAKVDDNKTPIRGTEEYIKCDTLLLSVGLIPENELSKKAGIELSNMTSGAIVDQDRQTKVEGIFACGNVLHVHDLVDYVSKEAEIAGKAAARYLLNKDTQNLKLQIKTDGKIRYTVPQIITKKKQFEMFFRVSNIFKDCKIIIKDGKKEIANFKRKKLSPGQMEKVIITEEIIEKVEGNNIFVELEHPVINEK